MALITMLDVQRGLDPMGKLSAVVELKNQTNGILCDVRYQEGNLPTGHKAVVRTGIPEPTLRLLNQGVTPSKSTKKAITFECAQMTAYSEVDKTIADLGGNAKALRADEAKAHLEGFNQKHAEILFYGSKVNPEEFVGLKEYYDTISTDPEEAGYNILDAEGDTSSGQTSIWFVVWGKGVYGIYPSGLTAGFHHEDKGQVTLEDSDGGKYEGYQDYFEQNVGLVVEDWRQVVRIANVDIADFGGSGAPDLVNLLTDATEQVNSLDGNGVFYMRRECRRELRRQITAKSNVNLTFENVAGHRCSMWDEQFPIRICDQLLKTEAVVS